MTNDGYLPMLLDHPLGKVALNNLTILAFACVLFWLVGLRLKRTKPYFFLGEPRGIFYVGLVSYLEEEARARSRLRGIGLDRLPPEVRLEDIQFHQRLCVKWLAWSVAMMQVLSPIVTLFVFDYS